MKRSPLGLLGNAYACGVLALGVTVAARPAAAQSFVDEVPEDACAAVETLDVEDASRNAEHLRRACRLQQLEYRLASERRQDIAAQGQAREARVASWVEATQPRRVIRPLAVAGYLGSGISNYGLIFSWNVLRQLELDARIGWRNMTCWDQFSPNGGDCTRRSIAAGARWYLMDTNFSPFAAGGFAITDSHLQILQSTADSNKLLTGSGRAHSVSAGAGLELDFRSARISVEYVYEHLYYAGANKEDMDMTPSPDLESVWRNSLTQDRHGVRVQAGYAF